jgi:hypothetical protein
LVSPARISGQAPADATRTIAGGGFEQGGETVSRSPVNSAPAHKSNAAKMAVDKAALVCYDARAFVARVKPLEVLQVCESKHLRAFFIASRLVTAPNSLHRKENYK